MSQCSTFPYAMLGLQYFILVKLLVNLIQLGIFMATLLVKGCIIPSNVLFLASALLSSIALNRGSFSVGLVAIINFEK